MIASKLKSSILQYAIQGKITQQLPEDGHAKNLVFEIKNEKRRLENSGILKKGKVFSEIQKDDIPFEIPENWVWIRLGEISQIIGGYAFKSSQYSIKGVRVIRISDFNESGLVSGRIVRYKNTNGLESYLIQKKDILICMTGGTVGKNYYMNDFDEPLLINQRVAIIRSILVNPKYIYIVMNSKLVQEDISRKKNSTNDNISMDHILNFKIPLPPLIEQNRIVEKIDRLLEEVDCLKSDEEKLNTLQRYIPKKLKDSIQHQAVQGKLTKQLLEDGDARDLVNEIKNKKREMIKLGIIKKEKPLLNILDDEKPFDIPDNWIWVRLGELSTQITDGTHKTPSYVSKGVPFLSIQNISTGKFDLSSTKFIKLEEHVELIKRCKPELGDILICRIGTLGKPIINTLNFDFSIFVSLGLIKLVNNNLNEYLVYYLSSPAMNKWIDENKVGGGTHTNKINLRDLINVPIPLPPLSEQIRIVEYLREILPICENIEKNYNKLN